MEDKKLTLAPEVEEPETAEDTNELYVKFAKPYIFGDKTIPASTCPALRT